MASKEESLDAGGETNSDPPPPAFPNGRRPSSGTDIGFEESISESELSPSEAPIDTLESSDKARESMLKRGSSGSILKPRKKWGSGRGSKSLRGVDLDNPEVKELLRRLSKKLLAAAAAAAMPSRLPQILVYNVVALRHLTGRCRRTKCQCGWHMSSSTNSPPMRSASNLQLRGTGRCSLFRKAWGGMVAEVQRKIEDIKKEKRLRKSIDKQFKEDLAKKAIIVMRRSNLRRYFRFFQEGLEARRQWREFLRKILILLLKTFAFRVFVGLRDAAQKRAHDRAYIKARVRITLLRRCIKGWWLLLRRNLHLRRFSEGDQLLRSAFDKWTAWVVGRKDLRARWQAYHKKLGRNMRNRMFLAFADVVRERKRVRRLVERQLQKSNRNLLNRCFQGWISFMQIGAQKKMEHVQSFASKAERKIEKLRSENERLSTIIDTGEWSKDRVSDLVGAQQVLSAERVALTKIIGRLQREHQLAVDKQGQQENEIRHLKNQFMSENNHFQTPGQRNKLLVKGASSFNTLMRLMKNDMPRKGQTAAATAATPEIVYQVGNMVLDQVAAFPDGELQVKAARPRQKGRWSDIFPNSGTRTSSAMSNKPPVGSRSHTPRIPEPHWQPDPPWTPYTRRA